MGGQALGCALPISRSLYVFLALGLNIVVGYAGLLDLGYVAFYAVGAYAYALLASPHFGIHLPFLGNPALRRGACLSLRRSPRGPRR
jgi:branched-chain amino acid transport system permease protein